MKIICENCNLLFERTKGEINRKKKLGHKNFCSLQCAGNYRKTKIKKQCDFCNAVFERQPSQLKKSKKHFCSHSCAALYNNPLREKTFSRLKLCKKCKINISKYPKITVCQDCNKNYVDWTKITIRDLKSKLSLHQFHARIRERARTTYKNSSKPKLCCNCGYTNHYQVCHIKDIKDFDLDTNISVVNHIDNLIGLCPNCHWEFDHGILILNF